MSPFVSPRPLPETSESPLLRVDFSDDQAWASLRAEIVASGARYGIDFEFVTFVDDPAYQQLSIEQLRALVPADYQYGELVLADGATFTSIEHPLLVIDLDPDAPPEEPIRIAPDAFYSVTTNLELGNLSFAEFAELADEDGIYRISDREWEAVAAMIGYDPGKR
jgi:hypothetical protein